MTLNTQGQETPAERETRLLAEAQAESAIDAQRDLAESLAAKPQIRRNWNRFSSGFNLSIPMPRFSLMKIERRNRKNKP